MPPCMGLHCVVQGGVGLAWVYILPSVPQGYALHTTAVLTAWFELLVLLGRIDRDQSLLRLLDLWLIILGPTLNFLGRRV